MQLLLTGDSAQVYHRKKMIDSSHIQKDMTLVIKFGEILRRNN